MIEQKIRNRYGDVVFINETHVAPRPSAAVSAELAVETNMQLAERFIRENREELGLVQSHMPGEEDFELASADEEDSPAICYSHQKDISGTAVVVYDQFVLDLPIFDARMGVQVDERARAVSAVQSSMHSHVEVANPKARATLDEPQPLSAAALRKAIGTKLEGMTDGRVARQVVYRYEEDKRTEPTADEPHGCFGEHRHFEIDLPPLPDSIRDGIHYVANEILFRASRFPDEPPVNWRALVEPESGAVLYIRALVADATGMVFVRDPQTQSAATVTGASSDAQLNPFATSATLEDLTAANPQALIGKYVKIAETSAPSVPGPQEPNPPATFNYNATTDNFSAVNAYYHCDKLFRTMADYGFNVFSYFGGTSFPVPVDHVALGNAVNAQAPGNATGTGLGELRFAKLQAGQPVGIATSNRVVWHEFGHALLWDHVNSPNFGFAHSAGDSLAAILNDPGSQAANRFDTFPWVQQATNIGRLHDRKVADGWAWFGPNYNTQYSGEQILCTTMFRFYQSIGGDAPWLSVQTRAAQTSAYLIFKAIGLLTSTTQFPEVFVTSLQNADLNTGDFKGIPGGALHKVVRWAFEKQGLFQPAAAPGQGNTVGLEGNPPLVDVYIDDGRQGEYPYLANHWSCQDMWVRRSADGGATHQNPIVGATNYMYVRVKNRGTQAATGVHVDGYHALPGSGLAFPDDWMAMATPTVPASGPIAPGGQTVVGPFAFQPTKFGHHCLMAIAHANGDPGNDTTITGTIPEHRFVPFDNNIGQRNIWAVFPLLKDLIKIFRRHQLLIRNPFRTPVVCTIEIELPRILRRLGWAMRTVSEGSQKFELAPRERREVIVSIDPGEEIPADLAKRAIAEGDHQIQIRTFMDGELVGGMTYALSFDAESEEKRPEEDRTEDGEPRPGIPGEQPASPPVVRPRRPFTIADIVKIIRGESAEVAERGWPVRSIRIELDFDQE